MHPSDLRKSLGLFRHFFAAYPLRSSVTVLLMLLAAASEGLGIAALLPLLRLATGPAQAGGSDIGAAVERGIAAVGLSPTIGTLLILVASAISLKSALVYLAMREVGYTATQVALDLRLALARALMTARWSFYVRQRLGSLTSALTGEPGRAAMAYVATCRVLVASIQAIAFCAIATTISWHVTLIALMTGLLSFPILAGFVRVSRQTGRTSTRLSRRFISRLVEGLSGIKPIKAMAGEDRLGSLLEADIRALDDVQRRIIVNKEGLTQIQEPVKVIALAIALFFLLDGWTQGLEALAVLAVLFSRAVQRIQYIQRHYQEIVRNLPAFWFVRAVTRRATLSGEVQGGDQMPRFDENLVFRGVSFRYGPKIVLSDADLTIVAGEMIGITGPSGAGKTTLADLALGLLRPSAGRVEIDGKSLAEIDLKAWRRKIGYVPQETVLFNDSVMTNLTLGDPALTRAQAETALRRAGAWDFVAALPDRLDSPVGERGAALSGGQRQRLAIARALIREPKLLILDEATTALDPETEAAICATLRTLTGTLTILAISHQPALIAAADRVYRVEQGRIVEQARGDAAPRPVAGLA